MKQNQKVFLDIEIDGSDAGRIDIELYSKEVPITAENFKCLCTGEKGIGKKQKDLHYMNTKFHRIISGFMMQGGDIIEQNGRGGESIYGDKFGDENFIYKNQAYSLAMANAGSNTNSSQFFINFGDQNHLDGKHVVFGKVINGFETLKKIESKGTSSGVPTALVMITACGEYRY